MKISLLAATLLATAAFCGQPAAYRFTTIAKLGGDSPFVSYFEPAAITDLGDILFAPDLTTGGEGVYLWRRGQLSAIARGGDTMADGGVLEYTLSPVSMNVLGDAVFVMTRDGAGGMPPPVGLNAGVYRYNSRTGVTPVMVPGLEGHGGDAFLGSWFLAGINNRSEIVFSGMICSSAPTSVPTIPCPNQGTGLAAVGVYRADARGQITAVVKPGDPAPPRSSTDPPGIFDLAHAPTINDSGDIAFTGHEYGEECGDVGILSCNESLYLRRAATGAIESIAHYGDPSPIPGKSYFWAFSPVLNSAGDLVFLGSLSTPAGFADVSVLLHTRTGTTVVAKAGDPMPGGGAITTAGCCPQNAYLNNRGDVAFVAALDNGDHGLYLWRRGILSLVAKTGTNTGAGTIATLDDVFPGVVSTQIAMDDFGRILFAARFQEGGGGLLLATPR